MGAATTFLNKHLLILVSLLISSIALGQTTVFSDDFSSGTSDTYTTSGALSSFTVNRSGDDWGARRATTNTRMELSNDVGGTANVAGQVFTSLLTSAFSAPYSTTLNSNPGQVSWSFNMRQIRTDPSGFSTGTSYGTAFVLAANATDVEGAGTADGYAVILGEAGTDDRVRLVHFTDGLDATTSILNGALDFGTEYLSIVVTYEPSSDTWELFTRDDSGTFADPLGGTPTSAGTVVNSTYTGTALNYAGPYFQGSSGGSQNAFFDNIVISVDGAISNTTDYFRSLATGNWNTAGTWQSAPDNATWNTATLVPTNAAAAITIQTGHTVTINGDITAPSITIAGTGVLTFDGAAARDVAVDGDIAITGTGSFITQAAGVFTNTMSIGGNITNAGTFDMSRGGTTLVCDITFNKNGNQTISGAGATTRFNEITLDMGTSNSNILEISSSNFAAPDGFAETSTPSYNRIENGTLKFSGTFTYSGCPFIVNGQNNTIVTTAGLWLNNPNVTLTAIGDSYDIQGLLRVTDGVLNVGTSAGQSLNWITGSSIIVEGGTINVAGRLASSGNTGQYSTTFNQSGGTIVICTQGNTSTTRANLDFTNVNNSFTMSGGTIIVRNESLLNGVDVWFGAITSNYTAGTIQLGDASSSASFTNGFRFSSAIALPDVIVYNKLVSGTYPSLLLIADTDFGGILTSQANTIIDVDAYTATVTGATTILGTLTISTGTYDANGTFDATGGAVTFTGAGNLYLGSTVSSLGTFTESTSTVTYDRAGAQNIDSDTYYHLIVDGSGTKTLAGNLDVNGNLTISAGTLASTSTYDINLAGNWVNNGTSFTHASNLVTMDGGAAQTIGGATITSFYDLTINNSSGDVSIVRNAIAEGTVTMTSGKLSVQGYTLEIGTTSTNGAITGGSSTSYIVAYDNGGTIGYVKHNVNGNATYNYLIGDATYYTPLTFTLSAGTLNTADLTVHTKPTAIPDLNSTTVNYIDRYWEIDPTGISAATFDVSYTYDDTDIEGVETNYLPVKFTDGTTWYKPTGSSFTSGTVQGSSAGTNVGANLMMWTGLSTFSLLGGVGDGAIPLPIQMQKFEGVCIGETNELKWFTSSESNNDFFTLENSINGVDFEVIVTRKGAGNSTGKRSYYYSHINVREVLNYYRLKQTDFDGATKDLGLITIDNRPSAAATKEICRKINILGHEVNEYYRGIVIIVYSDGSSVKVIQ